MKEDSSGRHLVLYVTLCCLLLAPCYSYSRKQLSSRARASSRRLLSNNLEDAIKIDHRHLLAPLVGFTKLEFTLPSCMPMAGTTCSLNNAYLVEAMGDLNASELSIPQLLYVQEAAAAVLCPELDKEDNCKKHPFCKWEPNQRWCDIDPVYASINMHCEGSPARDYHTCHFIKDKGKCKSQQHCFFLPAVNSSDNGDCYPDFLDSSGTDEDQVQETVNLFKEDLQRLPYSDDIYGCCEGMDLVKRYRMCGAYRTEDECGKAKTDPADACIWDIHHYQCVADSVRLMIDTFGPAVSRVLQDEADACASISVSQCQTKIEFNRPDDDMLESILKQPLENWGECTIAGGLGDGIKYPPFSDYPPGDVEPPAYDHPPGVAYPPDDDDSPKAPKQPMRPKGPDKRFKKPEGPSKSPNKKKPGYPDR